MPTQERVFNGPLYAAIRLRNAFARSTSGKQPFSTFYLPLQRETLVVLGSVHVFGGRIDIDIVANKGLM